jgi:N-acetylneuraminate synthase
LKTAKAFIQMAATFCKADVVKFQKRNPRELLTPKAYQTPHPNPMHAYGETYGAHREALEFSAQEHVQLRDWCDEFGIVYSTSVWDLSSAKALVPVGPEYLKIPSACNLNFEMLRYLCDEFGGEIHLSLGMTTKAEEVQIVRLFEDKDRARDLVVYSCTSGYPVPFEDICLFEITRLKTSFEGRVKAFGFSGHHLGIAADIAAMTLGATWIERHLTLDRTWKGTDHAASLEPDGLRRLVRDLRNVSRSLAAKKTEILEIEKAQRDKLKWSPPC